MLAVQAVLFTWVLSRSGQTLPGQSPSRFGQTVAIDLANALGSDPHFDVEHYIQEQYARVAHPFFVVLADGRIMASGGEPIPEPLLRLARGRLHRRSEHVEPPRPERDEGSGFPAARAVRLSALAVRADSVTRRRRRARRRRRPDVGSRLRARPPATARG